MLPLAQPVVSYSSEGDMDSRWIEGEFSPPLLFYPPLTSSLPPLPLHPDLLSFLLFFFNPIFLSAPESF